ncbi:MAG: hypothetical protein QOG37_1088, partial [Mycobacterium sp.]|nr:hypothetical protein [Mycobacterium sp.]
PAVVGEPGVISGELGFAIGDVAGQHSYPVSGLAGNGGDAGGPGR